MSLRNARPLQGVGWGQQGPFVIGGRGVQKDTFWTLQSPFSDPSSLPREKSETRLTESKAEQAKGLPNRKLVTGFAFYSTRKWIQIR